MRSKSETSTGSEWARDCLGRDRFGGAPPEDEAPPAGVQEREARTFRDFVRAHKRAFIMLLAIIAGTVFVLAVLPQIAGFGDTLKRLRQGDKVWLALGVVFEALSIAGYIAAFRVVFSRDSAPIGWRESYEITMASVVATKLFAAAGAGGVALTAWALRASGLSGRLVARRMTSFEIILYAVYMGSLLVFGIGLQAGLFPGNAPTGLTVIPAAFGGGVILLALSFLLLPDDLSRWLHRHGVGSGRVRRLLHRLATVPNVLHDGMVTALEIVRRPRIGLLGAIGYWAFDIATLWACFRAFGASPPLAVVVMGYFVGSLANVIPVPGGIGGVEGGMIGAFIGFGVNGSTAVLAVLSYRALSFWLPTLPGAVAYFQLRRTIGRWRQPQAAEAPAGA